MKNVTLRQLRVFAAAARHMNFSRAAEELHLSQPAVSTQIKEFAALVGLPLFERIGTQDLPDGRRGGDARMCQGDHPAAQGSRGCRWRS